MTGTNKTVAEVMREDDGYGSMDCVTFSMLNGDKSCSGFTCQECRKTSYNAIADMIEAGQTVDVAALDLLCDKLECGSPDNQGIARQIRKAISSAERPHEVESGVDVDALLFLADVFRDNFVSQPSYETFILKPCEFSEWENMIRNAVKGANASNSMPLPEGVEWPRFEDGQPVKIGDEFLNNKGNTATVTRIALSEKHFTINKGQGRICKTYGNRIKRPEPEVLDADNVPIKVGDTVYDIRDGHEWTVTHIENADMVRLNNAHQVYVNNLTHRKPDTFESVVGEMLADFDSHDTIELDGYFDRLRKLMGGE